MKKHLAVLSIFALFFSGVIYAADSASIAPRGSNAIPDRFGGAVNLLGKTPRTWQVTIDNTARTLDNLVVTASGTYLGGSDNTLTPIAATVSCDNATRWSFQTTPSATVGHAIAAAGSYHFSGPDAMVYLRGVNAVEGTGASCAVTLWY